MIDAGAGKYRPLAARDCLLIPDGQRDQNPGRWLPGQRGNNPVAYPFSRSLYQVRWSPDYRIEQPVGWLGPNVAGGTDAAFQQPGAEVETVGVGQGVGTAQPHRELPTLAGMERRQRRRYAGISLRVPGKGNVTRYPRQGR